MLAMGVEVIPLCIYAIVPSKESWACSRNLLKVAYRVNGIDTQRNDFIV